MTHYASSVGHRWCTEHHQMIHLLAQIIIKWFICLHRASSNDSFACIMHHQMIELIAQCIIKWFICLHSASSNDRFFCIVRMSTKFQLCRLGDPAAVESVSGIFHQVWRSAHRARGDFNLSQLSLRSLTFKRIFTGHYVTNSLIEWIGRFVIH